MEKHNICWMCGRLFDKKYGGETLDGKPLCSAHAKKVPGYDPNAHLTRHNKGMAVKLNWSKALPWWYRILCGMASILSLFTIGMVIIGMTQGVFSLYDAVFLGLCFILLGGCFGVLAVIGKKFS